MSMKTKDQSAVSLPEEGDAYWTGFLNVIKLSGEDTGGAFSVVEEHLAPGDGAPPHIHHNEDQTDYVAKGEVEFTIGDRVVRATAGTIVHSPKGVPHAFKNVGEEKAVIYSWFHPAGFELNNKEKQNGKERFFPRESGHAGPGRHARLLRRRAGVRGGGGRHLQGV